MKNQHRFGYFNVCVFDRALICSIVPLLALDIDVYFRKQHFDNNSLGFMIVASASNISIIILISLSVPYASKFLLNWIGKFDTQTIRAMQILNRHGGAVANIV